ncbi:MAG TPA: 50S ribosomal protein L13 [bacterium]|nr:50S ribosomal protein L13 [bacterium]
MKTFVAKPAEVDRKWFVVDAENKVLGRLASELARILRGKKKPIFQPNVDTGDYVVVINAEKVILSGMKDDKKNYFIPREYIGHSKNMPFKEMMKKHPERIIEKAVKGMLPHNVLGRKIGRKLFVYAGPNHKHHAQKPELLEI